MAGRPIALNRPLSPFGTYLVELCTKRGVTLSHLAPVVGGQARLSYALRGRTRPGSRGALLDHATLEAVAKHLRANRAETRRLILLGMVEHAPKELRSAVIGMANDLVSLAHRLNVQPPNLDFSGKDVELTPDL